MYVYVGLIFKSIKQLLYKVPLIFGGVKSLNTKFLNFLPAQIFYALYGIVYIINVIPAHMVQSNQSDSPSNYCSYIFTIQMSGIDSTGESDSLLIWAQLAFGTCNRLRLLLLSLPQLGRVPSLSKRDTDISEITLESSGWKAINRIKFILLYSNTRTRVQELRVKLLSIRDRLIIVSSQYFCQISQFYVLAKNMNQNADMFFLLATSHRDSFSTK